MTVDTPQAKRLSPMRRSLSSFERELEKNSQNRRSSFNFHPTCLCPDCLDARQDNKLFGSNKEEEQTFTVFDFPVTSYKPEDTENIELKPA